MATIAREQLLMRTKVAIQKLDAVKSEQVSTLTDLRRRNKLDDADSPIFREKEKFIQEQLDMIDLGLDEAEIMMALARYLQIAEAEKLRLRTRATRLEQENAWLRDELANTQLKLQTSEQTVVQLEEKSNHFEFMVSLKTCCCENDKGRNDVEHAVSETLATEKRRDEKPAVESASPSTGHGVEKYAVTPLPTTQTEYAQQINAGCEIPARLRTLHNFIIQYASQGRYEVAVPLCKQALEDLERISGRDHPDVATTLNILALIYKDQNKRQQAELLLKEVLVIREKILGENHPAVAATLNNLAALYGVKGDYEEAESLSERALAIVEKARGPDHPDVAKQSTSLATLYQHRKKYDEVEKCLHRALAIYESKFGPDDANVAKVKNELASCYLKRGKYKKAEVLFKQVLKQTRAKAQNGWRA